MNDAQRESRKELSKITDTTHHGKTPLTDALALELLGGESLGYGKLWDHARRLEIDRAHAMESAAINSRLANKYLDELEALRSERTETINEQGGGSGRTGTPEPSEDRGPARSAPQSAGVAPLEGHCLLDVAHGTPCALAGQCLQSASTATSSDAQGMSNQPNKVYDAVLAAVRHSNFADSTAHRIAAMAMHYLAGKVPVTDRKNADG